MREIDKEKLYRTAFFLTYHKHAREGWFWRVFGMVGDGKMRETIFQMTTEYQSLASERAITFDEYLDLVYRQAQEKMGIALTPEELERESVQQFQKQYGLVSKGKKCLEVTIISADDDFENAITEGLAAIRQHLADGNLTYEGKSEYGHFTFVVKQI